MMTLFRVFKEHHEIEKRGHGWAEGREGTYPANHAGALGFGRRSPVISKDKG
jgi:hypothetical protein